MILRVDRLGPQGPQSARGRWRGRGTAWAGGAVVGVIVALSAAGPAAAHDRLLSSTPGADASVDVAPAVVQLSMSAELVDLGAQVQVSGPSGVVSVGEAQVRGTEVDQALSPEAPAGTYEVQWRVTSSDGHPISGSFEFTAAAASAPASAEATPGAPGASTEAEPEATPPATSPASPDEEGAATSGQDTAAAQGAGGWTPVVLAAAAGGIVGLGIVLLRRRRSRREGG